MTENEVQVLADRILREELGALGFEASKVRSGLDHDGEAALFITALFKPGAGPLPGRVSIEARGALGDALLANGEKRFPYLSHHYPDDERAEETAVGPARS